MPGTFVLSARHLRAIAKSFEPDMLGIASANLGHWGSLVALSEQRKHRRFDLSLPVQVRVKAQEAFAVEGSTRDIGGGGVYFTMPEQVEPGSELEFEVTLPGEVSPGKTVRVRCRGKVVRVNRQEGGSRVGVAATIEHYEFVALE